VDTPRLKFCIQSNVGPNPHAKEILVAYLPKQKILFQADMLNPNANGSIPIAQDVTLTFNENLQKLGLDIEKIYGVHVANEETTV
jgi:hypothetical protein